MYLHIKHNVIIVKGALRAAIYDNNCELIYSINRDALKIIQNATEGIDINRHKEFLEYLVSQEIATWEDTFFDIRQSYPHILENKRESTTPLNFLWLEITGRCNLQCVHCYADSSSSFNTATELDIEEWKKIIDNAYKLGTTSVQFIGGEPLLRRDLLELIHFTLRQGYDDIEIFTNGVLITNTFLEKIDAIDKVRFAVSLYSDIADIHDSITKVRGSWHQTVKALQAIKKYGYRIRVATVLMKHNQNSLEGLEQLCQQLDLQCGYPDIVRSTGRGSEELKPTLSEICSLRVLKSPNFYTNKTLFKNALHWNSCWAGKVAITPAGDVLPCIFARELAIGSLKHTSFKNILQSEKLLSFWHLTKDSISICKDCEYRYACRDCRPMASADTGNLFIRGNHCLYNPYTGYWNIQGDNNEQSISGDSFDNAEPN